MKCLTCTHCRLEHGFGGSEVTPAEPNFWTCDKGRWYRAAPEDRDDLVVAFLIGETCELWEADEAELRRRAKA